MQGLVIKNTGSWYWVKTTAGTVECCKIKGTFRIKGLRCTNPVAVGDRVELEGKPGEVCYITAIEHRKNYIVRKPTNLSKQLHILAANIDQALLMITLKLPETTTTFIDRFLATAEAYRIPAVLLINKLDVYEPEDREFLEAFTYLYSTIGYPCFCLSALHQEGINQLEPLLKDKISLLSGHSGVGKTTLINQLIPDLHLKTADISATHSKGTHTTTFSEMYELPFGGYIIDTPGIKGFGTIDMKPEEVGHFFPEIFAASRDCRFHNCTHTNEPDCAVLKAVAEARISQSRYTSYLSILNDQGESKYRLDPW